MNTIEWRMQNCECKIAYDYDPTQGDIPDLRSNHRHISKCQYHQVNDGKELHDELCVEQTQVAIAQRKIAELYPEVLKTEKDGTLTLDESKVIVTLDENRELSCVVAIDASKLTDLETALKGVCDRDVKVQ